MRGLWVDIYRHKGDGVRPGALSYRLDTAVAVVPPRYEGNVDMREAADTLVLLRGPLGSVRLVPMDLLHACVETAFGGCYAAGDSTFNEAVEALLGHSFYGAVKIHDFIVG